MSLNEKIIIKEKSIRVLFENIKNTLNKTSKISKENPNDWKYLTILSLTETGLLELENQLKEILVDS
jgi:hypothetical protein